ncbi:MAG TPA: hypothetical protein VN785_01855 [Candidatus Angelobacter sp.]|nr:hypothetical protein [Candidatus Angelobacter sp.]
MSAALTERVLEACVRRKVPVFYQAEMVAADGVSQRHNLVMRASWSFSSIDDGRFLNSF